MMSYPPSNSNNSYSNSFELLDPRIQKWIWQEGWNELSDVQEKTIPLVLHDNNDIIIASPTASGKTEAAFLPILSKIYTSGCESLYTIYISPLKALINDQFDRLNDLTDMLNLTVTKWHGDASQSKKKHFLENTSSVLQITPESIESLLINKTQHLTRIFSELGIIIIDEIHSFIGSERGIHLLSLLNRIELVCGRKIRRIGLSATLGDFSVAKNYLRSSDPQSVLIVDSSKLKHDVQLQLRGYQNKILTKDKVVKVIPSKDDIIEDIFNMARGHNNLIFANSRNNTEKTSLLLKTKCEKSIVPNEFFPHYGNLSKEVREDLESRLKSGNYPTTAVCTSTLELGIDIGKVKSVYQIGTPPSVSSLRQRLGRSGRRNDPSILRIFISENEINNDSQVQDLIRAELIQAIAMVELLIEKWYEPADNSNKHFSTLLHQILAMICQYGGCKATSLFKFLVEEGPFNVNKEEFIELLKVMGKTNLIIQDNSGLLLIGEEGEFLTEHYSFYSVFKSPTEYTLETNGKVLGTLPILYPIIKEQLLVFNAQRWVVVSVDDKRKRIYLNPSKAGLPPKFFGDIALINEKVRQKMFEVYCSKVIPKYLNNDAKLLLQEARSYFGTYKLESQSIFEEKGNTIIALWDSDKSINTLRTILMYLGFSASSDGFLITVEKANSQLVKLKLQSFLESPNLCEIDLANMVASKTSEKYDEYLNEKLLNIEYASKFLDFERVKSLIPNLL